MKKYQRGSVVLIVAISVVVIAGVALVFKEYPNSGAKENSGTALSDINKDNHIPNTKDSNMRTDNDAPKAVNNSAPISRKPADSTLKSQIIPGNLSVVVSGSGSQPYLIDPANRKSGVEPVSGDLQLDIPASKVNVSVYAGSINVKNPLSGKYKISTSCIKNYSDLYISFEFFPQIGGGTKYARDVRYPFICIKGKTEMSFMVTTNGVEAVTALPQVSNIKSSRSEIGGQAKTKLTWSKPSDKINSFRIYTIREDENVYQLLAETSNTSYLTSDPWIDVKTNQFVQRYIITPVDADGYESPFYLGSVENYSPLVARFYPEPACGPAPLTVRFRDDSLGNPMTWAWYVVKDRDELLGKEQNPTVTFDEPGSYTITLKITGVQGKDERIMVGAVTVGQCSD